MVLWSANTHLLETARGIFLHSKVPDSFWGESAQSSAYIVNRMLLSSLQNVSPFEKLYQKPPANQDITFGGKVVVFAGDLRKILPVVPKGSRQDIVF